MVVGAEMALEVGGGFVVWVGELSFPLHEEAVGEAAHEAKEEHTVGMADAAAVVVVGDIQTLVEAAFDAPGLTVELEPACGVEACWFHTGNEADFLWRVALEMATEAGGLGGEGKGDLFGGDGGGAQDADLATPLVALHRAGLGGGWPFRGKNPPQGRGPVSGGVPEVRVDCLSR